jgi:hypothetical protein
MSDVLVTAEGVTVPQGIGPPYGPQRQFFTLVCTAGGPVTFEWADADVLDWVAVLDEKAAPLTLDSAGLVNSAAEAIWADEPNLLMRQVGTGTTYMIYTGEHDLNALQDDVGNFLADDQGAFLFTTEVE